MSSVEEIVEAIKELPPEKRAEVQRQLALLWQLNSRESAANIDNKGHPYWANLHSTRSSTMPTKRARPRRPAIKIKGKPLSETVVEDRR